jgi:hypothetical protein
LSGKRTYLYPGPHGHKGLEGGWVRPLPRAIDWPKLEAALGRKLTDAERDHVQHIIKLHAQFLRSNDEARVSAQDRKATLRGLSEMPLPEVQAAYRRADGLTRAEIDRALLPLRIMGWQASPEQIKAAAVERAGKINGRAGRRRATAALDRAILELWADLGGRESRPAARKSDDRRPKDYATPIVEFAHALCTAAGGRAAVSKAAIADRLRKARAPR